MVTKKTTKAAAPKAKKPVAPKKAGTAKKTVAPKNVVSDEDIRKKAEEIYYERVSRGEHGTPEEDWVNAEKFLKAGKKK